MLGDTSIGHSIGLEMHEIPHLAWGSDEVIEENMVLCVEPWMLDYSDWSLGRNFEDMVLVTADGMELLSPGFEDLVILPTGQCRAASRCCAGQRRPQPSQSLRHCWILPVARSAR